KSYGKIGHLQESYCDTGIAFDNIHGTNGFIVRHLHACTKVQPSQPDSEMHRQISRRESQVSLGQLSSYRSEKRGVTPILDTPNRLMLLTSQQQRDSKMRAQYQHASPRC